MIHVKHLDSCSLKEVLEAWNDGFQDYVADLQMDLDAFLKRTVGEQLSPELSHVAFDGEKPIGVVMNGVKNRGGRLISWNGGTAVHPDYRDQGVGHKLVAASLETYHREGVELATLEAVSDNDSAIHLYETHGYEVEDHLSILQQEGQIDSALEIRLLEKQLSEEYLKSLSWYPIQQPWQCQEDRDGHIVMKGFYKGEELVGYSVQTRNESNGELERITIHQIELNPSFEQDEMMQHAFLNQAIYADKHIKRTVINIRHQNLLYEKLKHVGFQEVFKQVWMLASLQNGE